MESTQTKAPQTQLSLRTLVRTALPRKLLNHRLGSHGKRILTPKRIVIADRTSGNILHVDVCGGTA
jgi:hypothetical protein